MVWHIFRKDWKLLWRMATGVALLNLLHRAILSSAGPFADGSSPLAFLSSLLGIVSLLASGVLVVMLVQQDAIPGFTQDWLVRPIQRRDLLLSKVLFVVLAVQGPVFMIEVGQGLAAGFPLSHSLAAPFSRSLWMLLALDLPVMAFATLTRTLAQAAGVGIAMIVGFAVFTVSTVILFNSAVNSVFNSHWATDSAKAMCGLAGAAAVLALQYYARKTGRARWVFGVSTLLWLVIQFLPWHTALAIAEPFSPQPKAANLVQILFEPGYGKLRGPSPVRGHTRPSGPTNDVHLWVPLRKTGLREGQILTCNRISARVIAPGGAKIDFGDNPGSYFFDAAENPSHELVWVPEGIYNRLKDQLVGIEIDYSFSLLQANSPQSVPAPGGDRWMEGVGRCTTRMTADGTHVELGCMAPGDQPCVSLSLDHDGSGQERGQRLGCRSDFAPYFARLGGDSITRFSREFHGMYRQLKDTEVVITAYRPEAQFTRRVVIPNIRMSDWWVE